MTAVEQAFLSAIAAGDRAEGARLFAAHPAALAVYAEIEDAFAEATEAGDADAVGALFARHPHVLRNPGYAADFLHAAAEAGRTAVVARLVELGADVNAPRSRQVPDRPIGSASALDRLDTVRWLLAHGSDVNYEWDGWAPKCGPLTNAIVNDNLEMCRLLVDHGAALNVVDRTNRTPLTWALDEDRADIAAFLRSKGAIEARDCPGYRRPELTSAIVAWIEGKTGATTPLPGGPVAVRAGAFEGRTWVFTTGMSDRAMSVPPGREAYRYAELVLAMPAGPSAWDEPATAWAVMWLRQLAQYPFDNNTWLGAPVTVVTNGEPPQPLGPGTAMTGWLLCADKAPFDRASLQDGRAVVFYTLLPLHPAECDFERRRGPRALLELFAGRSVPEHWDPRRPSAV
jgi:uncharacterized protein